MKLPCDQGRKFKKLTPHVLLENIKAPLCKQILYVSIAQSEPGIGPNDMANDIRRESVVQKLDIAYLDKLSQVLLHSLAVNITISRLCCFPS